MLVRPSVFDFQFTPAAIFRQRENSQSNLQPAREIAVYLDGNFAAPPLRLRHPRERDEVVVWLRPGYSKISSS
jgi:hypothetical protein